MFRFFVDQAQIGKSKIIVTGSDVNHIKNVLRMKPGEQVLISNKVDRDYLCAAEEITSETAAFCILEELEEGTELPARIWLFQGLPKSDKMELIIQKAVELGAYQVVPMETKRSIVKLDAKKAEAKVKRWNAIAESAAKQSKRIIIPKVSGVMSFQEALGYISGFDKKLIPYECATGIKETKKQVESVKPGMNLAVLIGPEGGFEENEIEQAKQAGVCPITLGKRILRTETAGLCILSALMLELEQ